MDEKWNKAPLVADGKGEIHMLISTRGTTKAGGSEEGTVRRFADGGIDRSCAVRQFKPCRSFVLLENSTSTMSSEYDDILMKVRREEAEIANFPNLVETVARLMLTNRALARRAHAARFRSAQVR